MTPLRRTLVNAHLDDKMEAASQSKQPFDSALDVEAPPHKDSFPDRDFVYVFDPFSKPAYVWGCITSITDATYSAFLVPLGVAFHFDLLEFSWYNAVNVVFGVVYILDIAYNFRTAFIVVHNLRRSVVRDRVLIAEYYMRYSTFWPDLLAALPLVAEVTVLGIPRKGGGLAVHIVLLLRLFRMWRVIKLVERLMFISMLGRYSQLLMRLLSVGHLFLLSVIYATAVLINVLACLWYYVATLEGLEVSWLTHVGNGNDNLADASKPRQWVAAVYYVTATITTVGYGDVTANTAVEQLVAVVIMLLGIIFFGFVISTSQELMKHLSKEASKLGKLRKKLQTVEVWTRRRHVSVRLRRRIRSYYAELRDDSFFAELPAALRTDIAHELARPLLAQSDVFNCLTSSAQRVLAARLVPQATPAGHNVAQEGDDADMIWLLQEGEVLSMRRTKVMELIAAPAIIGEGAILHDLLPECRTRPETLRAVAHCTLWSLSLHDLGHVFVVCPKLRHDLLDAYLKRLERIRDSHGGKLTDDWMRMHDRVRVYADEARGGSGGGGGSDDSSDAGALSDCEVVPETADAAGGGDTGGKAGGQGRTSKQLSGRTGRGARVGEVLDAPRSGQQQGAGRATDKGGEARGGGSGSAALRDRAGSSARRDGTTGGGADRGGAAGSNAGGGEALGVQRSSKQEGDGRIAEETDAEVCAPREGRGAAEAAAKDEPGGARGAAARRRGTAADGILFQGF